MLTEPLQVVYAQYPWHQQGCHVRLTFREVQLIEAFDADAEMRRNPVLLLHPVIEIIGDSIFNTPELDAYNPIERVVHLYGRLSHIRAWERHRQSALAALKGHEAFARGVLFVPLARPTADRLSTKET